MKKNIIGIIGGGNMGTAIVRGLVEQKLCPADHILLCDLDNKRAMDLKKAYKIHTGDLNTIISNAEIIILAIKPQDMEEVLKQIQQVEGKLFISIAAGLTTKFFEKRLGGKAKVVRAMPNLPALICKGVTGFCRGSFTNDRDMGKASRILEALGEVIEFKESQMDAVTAISGSGPAYVFLFVEQWIAAAKSLGLEEKDAKTLVCETLIGSADLLKKQGFSASELREKVTSKGGTTQAAMDIFREEKFDQLMKKALLAAKKRAKELAK